jgi:predicted glycosyltransferase
MIYSQDGLGLGHLRRTTLLATEFLAARPGGSVLTICDSPLGQFFSTMPGHDYLKLPSIRKTSPGNWSPVGLATPFDDVLALRKETIRTAALGFDPDVLLVDHMPHGAMGELVPTLQALESTPVRVVLGLRDILDAPATVRRRWHLEGAFEAVERFFGDVLVYGSRDVFDVAAQYGWPARLANRLRYCGYVCSKKSTSPVEVVRRRYLRDREDSGLVVAMAGGGADAYTLFDTLLRALPAVTAERPCVVVVVTGPFLPEAEHLRLQRLADSLPVHLVTTVHDSLAHLEAADLVVGMAGYNTTAEILSLPARALLVPREGPSAEQRMRVSRFGERGWIRWLAPELLTPDSLAAAMVTTLDAPAHVPCEAPDLRGRESAARYLLSGLAGRTLPRAAVAVNGARAPDTAEAMLRERHG